MTLRIRRADTAPGVGSAEYFGRTPESVLTDKDCSLNARAFYGVITLHMVIAKNPLVCLDPLHVLAQSAGISTRQARRLVAELEARGHVNRERCRTISGSPQGIRPTARLKPARTRSDLTDCNRSNPSEGPDTVDTAPGQICPIDRTRSSGTIKREGKEKKILKIATAATDGPVHPVPPPPCEETESPEEIATALASLKALIRAPGAWKDPGSPSAKSTPGVQSRETIPDAKDCTAKPEKKSTPVTQNEHKDH